MGWTSVLHFLLYNNHTLYTAAITVEAITSRLGKGVTKRDARTMLPIKRPYRSQQRLPPLTLHKTLSATAYASPRFFKLTSIRFTWASETGLLNTSASLPITPKGKVTSSKQVSLMPVGFGSRVYFCS